MKKSYEIEKGLEIGDKIFLRKEVSSSSNIMVRFITGHIVINNKDGEQEVFIFLNNITEATVKPLARDEIMTPEEAKEFLENKHNEMLKKTFDN